ncbi:O171 family O-antigen flippase [Escherichia coli]|nr:hypothetical protein [Escherichia coli]
MNKKNASHIGIFFLGEMLSKVLPFLLLPFLTRYLPASDFGRLGYFMSLMGMGLIAVNWSFDGAIARYYYRYGKFNILNVYYTAIVLSLALTFVLCLVASFFNNSIYLYAVVCAFLQGVFNILSTFQQCQKNAFKYIAIQFTFSIISTALTIVLVLKWHADIDSRIVAILVGLSCAIFIGMKFLHVYRKIHVKDIIKKLNFTYLLSFGLPLIFHQISLMIKGQLDRIIIATTFDYVQLAHYTAGYQVASVISVGIMAVNKAIVPTYYEACKSNKINKSKIYFLFWLLLPICLLPSIITYFIPPVFFVALLGEKYEFIGTYVTIFTFGFMLQIPYLLLVNYLFYLNKTRVIAKITILSSIVHIVSIYILKSYGIVYIPWALVLSNVFCIFLLYFYMGRKD